MLHQKNKQTKKQKNNNNNNYKTNTKNKSELKELSKKFKAISAKGLTKYFINKKINLVFLIQPNIFLQIKHTLNILFYTVL